MITFIYIVGIYCLALIMMTMIFFGSKLLDRGVDELWNKFVLSFKYGIIATTIGLTVLGW